MPFLIIKADGATEPFDRDKLLRSLTRSGASADAALHIAQEIENQFSKTTGAVNTSEIYARAFAHLRRESHGTAARYSLKRAVLEFGPTGFPFEAYIAELFRAEGYSAKIDQYIRGVCVEHEVDIVREKENEIVYAEAKFHNALGLKTDLKTALYVKARVDDIGKGRGMVITNTKFTSKAIEYSACVGLELLGWDYPQNSSLHERIDKAGVYPITALTKLSIKQKTALLQDKTVLCNDLSDRADALIRAGITGKKADEVLAEAASLCVGGRDI